MIGGRKGAFKWDTESGSTEGREERTGALSETINFDTILIRAHLWGKGIDALRTCGDKSWTG